MAYKDVERVVEVVTEWHCAQGGAARPLGVLKG